MAVGGTRVVGSGMRVGRPAGGSSWSPRPHHPGAARPARRVVVGYLGYDVRLSSTGFDGDHQAWRNIDGGTEEVPGGTAGAVDPDDVGRPSGPGVASQRVPADR